MRGGGWYERFALAVGCLIFGAGAVHAGSVTLYGVADQAVEYARGSRSVTRIDDGRQAASRFGMRGVEDLGGNLKAIFVAEAGFRMDTGAEFFGNGSLFGRQALIGLKGNWGEVRIGRQYTPAFYVIARLDPFSLNAAVSPFTLVAKSSAQGTGYVPYASRADNALTYNTPDWNGLSASATYAFGEVPGEMQQGSTYGANIQYFRGPVYLMYGFQASTNKPATAAVPQGQTRSHFVGGTFNIAKKVELGAFFGYSASQIAATAAARYYALTMDWVASPTWTVKLAAVKRVVVGMTERPLGMAFGVDHALSRRTVLYSRVAYIRNSPGGSVTINAIPIDQGSGDDGYSVSLGIKHVF
ncbi:porin [Cupriavidus agavae]|uniref:Putative porin n=1 Tax=Cupriavidus agavae TaxID=1001822 RepID=A0A4Q7RB20_9BURK|nr:porin [Cupriavidus agavae]RZT28852.1 putative porin [Cupriavidus agavae]